MTGLQEPHVSTSLHCAIRAQADWQNRRRHIAAISLRKRGEAPWIWPAYREGRRLLLAGAFPPSGCMRFLPYRRKAACVEYTRRPRGNPRHTTLASVGFGAGPVPPGAYYQFTHFVNSHVNSKTPAAGPCPCTLLTD